MYVIFCESLDFMGITSSKRKTQNEGQKKKKIPKYSKNFKYKKFQHQYI